ncbi:MAG: hypothetical protein MUC49_02320 [Raineya sp.]|jgi:hypothetical protein|nr:hypothetical protein [Raineya sp.]
MIVETFSLPRTYDNLTFLFGGQSYRLPYVQSSQTIIPFVQADFAAVDRRPSTENLQTFFGIDNNFPLPPTLNNTGRGRNLLNAARLSALDSELTPIYGYPGWLSLSLKDWVKYEMTKENTRWLALNSNYDDISKQLEVFANNVIQGGLIYKMLYSFSDMPVLDVQNQSNQNFTFFKTLEDGAEYRKYVVPNKYANIDSKIENAIEIVFKKPFLLNYLAYFQILELGDTSIDLSAFNTVKDANDLQVDLYFVAPPAILPFSRYPLFTPEPNINTSTGTMTITLHYELGKVETKQIVPKIQIEPQEKKEEEKEEETPKIPKKSKEEMPYQWILFAFIILVLVLILKKITEK